MKPLLLVTLLLSLTTACHQDRTSQSILDLASSSAAVFEGSMISQSEKYYRNQVQLFDVTFRVRKMWKKDPAHISEWDYVRLAFRVPMQLPDNKSCKNKSESVEFPEFSWSLMRRSRRRRTKRFFVFIAKSSDTHKRSLRSMAAPMPKSRRSLRSLQKALKRLKRGPRKNRRLVKSKTKRAHAGQSVRLTCITDLNDIRNDNDDDKLGPPSARSPMKFARWLKNDRPISRSTRIATKSKRISKNRIKHILTIRNVTKHDGGRYRCVTRNGVTVTVTKLKVMSLQKTRSNVDLVKKLSRGKNNLMKARQCPINNYCLNGGICRFYASIGEMSCVCASGFKGQRCEFKTLDFGSIPLEFSSSKCILGITHYPC